MTLFTCPVCGCPLNRLDKTLKCDHGHSHDISRYGYVNLLMSNKSSKKRHGDDSTMVLCRSNFLNKGYYAPIRRGVWRAIEKNCTENSVLLDAGCGECWYTAYIAKMLREKFPGSEIAGVDISKESLRYGAKRDRDLQLAVASTAHIPMASDFSDFVLNIFSPLETAEFRRVLKPGGKLIRVIPLERHLWQLKCAVYDAPYENDVPPFGLDGFDVCDSDEIKTEITLTSNEDIENLFKMTPYYYKTSEKDQAKLHALETLITEIEVAVITYKKI